MHQDVMIPTPSMPLPSGTHVSRPPQSHRTVVCAGIGQMLCGINPSVNQWRRIHWEPSLE
ncbi:hypothetical protein T4E_10231 [Trichinella pseudospiralis]|uniref:Uncharacterized protein n=1 Tax=Trichinella pseudospiralis TaxID=6337 RepID=A0A0V0YGQ7_TRIPS|nr:hypothetical protein T4E_10231 [Trichinella pseudospiralis]